MPKEYVIEAGSPHVTRPELIVRGTVEKGLGQSSITETDKTPNRRCDIGFPNRTEVWAKRVIRGKDGSIRKSGAQVDIKDPEYTGETICLEWGDPDGTLIVHRYLKGYNTLDLLYQDNVLNASENIRDNDESSESAYCIRVKSGDNSFDETTDPMLIKHLKSHSYNDDSVSRNPKTSLMSMFRNKLFDQVEEVLDKTLDAKWECTSIIKKASSDSSGTQLKNLFKIVSTMVSEDVKDENLYSFLIRLADKNPDKFHECIVSYKRDASDAFEKAKAFEAIDLTKNGTIVVGKNKKEVIATDIDAKGDGMIDWCIQNFTDPKAYEVIFHINKLSETIK